MKKISFIAVRNILTARTIGFFVFCVAVSVCELTCLSQISARSRKHRDGMSECRVEKTGKYSRYSCLCLTFGNYMRFDLLRVKNAYSMVYVSISLAFHGDFFLRFFALIFFMNFWPSRYQAIVIVICEHKRINVFISLRNRIFNISGSLRTIGLCLCLSLSLSAPSLYLRYECLVYFFSAMRLSINQLRIHYYFSYGIIVYKNKADKVDVTSAFRLAINFVYFSDYITARICCCALH